TKQEKPRFILLCRQSQTSRHTGGFPFVLITRHQTANAITKIMSAMQVKKPVGYTIVLFVIGDMIESPVNLA
ncbi:hypothetical protein Q4R69_12040, partial [Morganella morganii subsp. sibonii]